MQILMQVSKMAQFNTVSKADSEIRKRRNSRLEWTIQSRNSTAEKLLLFFAINMVILGKSIIKTAV